MKKIWDSIAKDLWIVLLDIIAVNASYFLALLIRFMFRMRKSEKISLNFA